MTEDLIEDQPKPERQEKKKGNGTVEIINVHPVAHIFLADGKKLGPKEKATLPTKEAQHWIKLKKAMRVEDYDAE